MNIYVLFVIAKCILHGVSSGNTGKYKWVGTLSITSRGLVINYCMGSKWKTMMVTNLGLYKNIKSGIWVIS